MNRIVLITVFLLGLCLPALSQFNGCPAGFCSPVSAPSTPFSITHIGDNSNTGGASTYTYTAQSIGTADPTRIVVVDVVGIAGAISTVTIGGATASHSATCSAINSSGTTSDIWYLAVPTGTTATIVVTYTASALRNAIGVYSVIGTSAAFSTCGAATANGTTVAATATIPSGGGAVGAIVAHTATSGPITISNLTVDTNNLIFGASTAAFGHTTTGTGSTSFLATPTASTDMAISIATFSP